MLKKYCWIQDNLYRINVSKDMDFQRNYNGFYKVRRNESWRAMYYKLMEKAKSQDVTFKEVLCTIKKRTGRIEPSFASKIVATLKPDKPVIDKHVLKNFDLHLPHNKATDRVNKTIQVYNELSREFWGHP